MQNQNALISQIIDQVNSTQTVAMIQPPAVGQTDKKNELLMFAKPEIFTVGGTDAMRASLDMFFAKLAEFDAQVSGVAIVGGQALEEKEIMNRHYGFINRMSRTASEAVNAEDRAKIQELTGVSLDEYPLYGGNEFLKKFTHYTPASLDALWATKKSARVRGGFYVQAYEAEGEKFTLVNAFHPSQLSHFTDPSHRIVLMLIHSNTDWNVLRGDLIGATAPEKAVPGSIRGMLYADPGKYGFEQVGAGNNGVHLSAGPYEGVFEIINFLGSLFEFKVEQQPPLVIRRLQEAGLSLADALKVTENPTITVDGKTTDLFGATEDINTDEAVALYINGR